MGRPAKITQAIRKETKIVLNGGATVRSLAAQFNVCRVTMINIEDGA